MTSSPIEMRAFAERANRWLDSGARDSDVVISSRTRLARNLADMPFPSHLTPDQALAAGERLREALLQVGLEGDTQWITLGDAGPVMRLLLLERNLISRDLVNEKELGKELPGRGVAFSYGETLSAMVGEEDHLRLCSLAPGFDLRTALGKVRALDQGLETLLPYAWNEPSGYLTACPTNLGTGLRASIMLHLPGLSLVRSELQKVFTAAQHTGLAVRGMHGEGSRAAGDFFQISNQITLGRSEEQLLEDMEALVPYIVGFERSVREALLEEHRGPLHDRISKSYATLRTSRSLPTGEALAHISAVRLGVNLGLLPGVPLGTVDRLWTHLQKGHLQALSDQGSQELLEATERDKLRASLVRSRLG
ncbi:MAG: ATP--guanido phosphotransferase [Planctomycetes bacterium]|nr:ATP--guanido phosphotransferase [Planctomycetota bacterium]MCB9909248.1 ATP--guanido phosphotransferase [Planctomycetota bacterium]